LKATAAFELLPLKFSTATADEISGRWILSNLDQARSIGFFPLQERELHGLQERMVSSRDYFQFIF
jgi:hypothetical protein